MFTDSLLFPGSDSASVNPPKRKSVAAESAFQGAAGYPGATLRRPRALTYSDFEGCTADVLCQIAKISVDEAGVYIIKDAGLHHVTISSDPRDDTALQSTHVGSSLRPHYGTGLLGVGKTKRAIYVCTIPFHQSVTFSDLLGSNRVQSFTRT